MSNKYTKTATSDKVFAVSFITFASACFAIGVVALIYSISVGHETKTGKRYLTPALACAYNEGFEDGSSGVTADVNPYQGSVFLSSSSRAWLDGWKDAKEQNDEGKARQPVPKK